MDLYEYQARDLFEKHGVPVLRGVVAEIPEQASEAAVKLGTPVVAVKAQVKVGGRGKAGGVKIAKSPQEAAEHAKAILGMDIKGHTVHKVMIAEGADIAEEYYFSILLDRGERRYLAMCSREGGMDIETLAKERPEALAKVPVDPIDGIDEAKAREILTEAGFPEGEQDAIVPAVVKLWETYRDEDATLVEVNPMIKTGDGRILAIDGKMTVDNNASFRQPEHAALVDRATTDPLELRAGELGLNYVKLDGNVGVIGNGAGLVMSTLDCVAYAGEEFPGSRSLPTSSTSAVAPRPRSWPTALTSSWATSRSVPSSSTSSAASPPATRWRWESRALSRSWARRPPSRSSSVLTATTWPRAARFSRNSTTRS